MRVFEVHAHRSAQPALATTALPPLTAAGYVRLRREAAGLKVEQVARRLLSARYGAMSRGARGPVLFYSIKQARGLLEQLELPRAVARHRDTINMLANIIGFDPAVYWQLATDPADRHPMICRGCGCSSWDPCHGEQGVCTLEHDICTRCERSAEQVAA